METLLAWVFLLTGLAVLVGLIRPSLVKIGTRRRALVWYGLPCFASLVMLVVITPHAHVENVEQPGAVVATPEATPPVLAHPTGATTPVASPPSAPQPEPKLPRGIGKSYDQIASFPSATFAQQTENPLLDGRPRAILSTKDNLATLEVIGPKENPVSASLFFFVVSDRPDLTAKHLLIALAFLANVAPDWRERVAWATKAIKRAAESDVSEEQIVHDSNIIKVKLFKPLSMVSIAVTPSLD